MELGATTVGREAGLNHKRIRRKDRIEFTVQQSTIVRVEDPGALDEDAPTSSVAGR
jgi:hypothetical protein